MSQAPILEIFNAILGTTYDAPVSQDMNLDRKHYCSWIYSSFMEAVNSLYSKDWDVTAPGEKPHWGYAAACYQNPYSESISQVTSA